MATSIFHNLCLIKSGFVVISDPSQNCGDVVVHQNGTFAYVW